MTPSETLALAQQLLDRPDSKTAGLWPRAAALLARQALEEALDAYWRRRGLALGALGTRAQLICLPAYFQDTAQGAAVRHAWNALSRSCHHHPYEYAPAAPELRRWIDAIPALMETDTHA